MASALRRRPYVLVEPEKVHRVVATLDRSEPVPGRTRVGLADPPLALIAEKADVRTAVTLAQRRREVGYPVLVHRRLIGALVERGDVNHDVRAAVGERGGLSRHPGHRPTEHPDLYHSHLSCRGLEVLDDRLCHGAIDSINEHRAPRGNRVVVVLLGWVDLRVAHRLDHVYDRYGERSKWRDGALARIDLARVGQHRHHDE